MNHKVILSTASGSFGLDDNIKLIKYYGFECIHVGNKEELLNLKLDSNASIISDRTTFLIPDSILDKYEGLKINMHNSLLPNHIGSYALFWSCLYGDDYGLTVHNLSNKLDEGAILFQLKIEYDLNNTFKDVYNKTRFGVNKALEVLLKSINENFKFYGQSQNLESKYMHYTKNALPLFNKLPKGWDTKIYNATEILEGLHDESGRMIKRLNNY
jgi:hypothetical protein